MAQETVRLAEFGAALRYEDLPASVVQQAKDCIIDTVAAGICGSALPWSRIVIDYAERTGPGGKCRIFGRGGPAVQAPAAALANGALAHAFELDSLTRPGAGAHPGATVLPPALAIAQERGADGRALIAAFVAGNEVMIRIGRATGHTNEARGFHAPGTTGPFGGAVAAWSSGCIWGAHRKRGSWQRAWRLTVSAGRAPCSKANLGFSRCSAQNG